MDGVLSVKSTEPMSEFSASVDPWVSHFAPWCQVYQLLYRRSIMFV